ncbi:glutaminase A [Cyanobium sp. Morenito 9A2]|uniref:glutaminase A n=1 Tax=Cyanobium sp. Morenito 9A2 TaxID=2823718 RepID=UPI0020CE87D2|nr:glutaminase A [Cyanobium sp. Morenito 9A2]MCP9851210.1 glutaminase A [Cyanobium sp. Morenito 9A2]
MVEADSRINAIQGLIDELHQRYLSLEDGAPANYIPELAKADPRDFGIVIATVDGRLYQAGDAGKSFTIQSISKPFVYGLALKLLGPECMVAKVGVEPSGEAFNAISLDPTTGRPRNPMINAGAIATTAQIACRDPENAEATVLDFFAQLVGRRLGIDDAVFRSERATGHRNRSIGHLLRNFAIIETDPELSLDLYFRQCSIQVTCRDLAIMAATLACQGRNPFTGARPLSPDITRRVLALMASCGTYDFAGQWLHDVGMPAKSGVGGGILAVVPGRLGIAIYSPPLDSLGNSVRGIAVCNELSGRLGLSLFNQYPQSSSTVRRSYTAARRQSRRWRSPPDREALRASGQRIRVVHVQGILDFAALERLVAELAASLAEARVLVLDLAHVIELPAESAELLAQQLTLFQGRGLEILLSRSAHLDLEGVRLALGQEPETLFCPDLDQSIERAENLFLALWNGDPSGGASAHENAFSQGFLSQLNPTYRQRVAACLERRDFAAGETVIRRGDPGDELFLVHHGRFTATIQLQDGYGRPLESRLATFGPGMCFGEIAFLSGQRRTASVASDLEGGCLVLSRPDFDQLRRSDPEAMNELLLALICDVGQKLSLTSHQLTQMEHL